MKKTIGILGGMGPLATADLYRKIVESTRAQRDADHVRVYIDSNPAIPDRTAAILSGGPDPVPEMLCVVMPCNTAHYFLPRLQAETALPILDMPAITAARCAEKYPGQRACVLATRGTLASGLYDEALSAQSVPFLLPDEAEREMLMHLIYDVVKASKPVEPERENWTRLLDGLRQKGADFFILGCTELPILSGILAVPGPFIDPSRELARAAVRFCGYDTIDE